MKRIVVGSLAAVLACTGAVAQEKKQLAFVVLTRLLIFGSC